MFKKIIHKLCQLRNKIIDKDDFNWKKYHINYYNQLEKSKEDYTQILSNEFKITDGKLEFFCDPPLTDNAELLYQIIYDLNPKSILEVGCGGGDHMANLLKIMPEVDISGSDLLPKQLRYLEKRNPELKGRTFVNDITKEFVLKAELIFTQAVIMHIQKSNRHLNALKNLINASTKYVVLMENWTRHNFYEDIENISLGLKEDLHIYKVDNGKQIIMVISKVPIVDKKLNYVKLESDEEMLKYLK